MNIPTIKELYCNYVCSQSLVALVPPFPPLPPLLVSELLCPSPYIRAFVFYAVLQINRFARLNIYTTFVVKLAEVALSLITEANSTAMRQKHASSRFISPSFHILISVSSELLRSQATLCLASPSWTGK